MAYKRPLIRVQFAIHSKNEGLIVDKLTMKFFSSDSSIALRIWAVRSGRVQEICVSQRSVRGQKICIPQRSGRVHEICVSQRSAKENSFCSSLKFYNQHKTPNIKQFTTGLYVKYLNA